MSMKELLLLLLTPLSLAEPLPPWGSEVSPSEYRWGAYRERDVEQQKAEEQSKRDLLALEAVWLHAEDAEAKKLVDENRKRLSWPIVSAEEGDASVYGSFYAKAADPAYSDNPIKVCERFIANVPDEGRKSSYNAKLRSLKVRNANRRQYFGFYSSMVRDEVRHKYLLEQGFAALLAGWEPDAPHAKKARGLAVKAFGEEWVKEYEAADDKDKCAATVLASSSFHRRTWEWIQQHVAKRVERVKAEGTAEYAAELVRLETERQRQLAEEAHEKEVLTARVSILAAAALTLAALAWGVKRCSKTWGAEHWASLVCTALLGVAAYGAEDWFRFAEWSRRCLPSGYYTFMRLAVTMTAGLWAWRAVKSKAHPLAIVLWASLALLFQPFVCVELKEWAGVDLAAMAVFLVSAFWGAKNTLHDRETSIDQ